MKRIGWSAGLAVIVSAGPAHAHSSFPGIEGFYVGFLHPFSTPAQALVILGLGFLAGGFDAARTRWHLGAFLAAILIGMFLGNGSDQDVSLFAVAFLACAWAALAPGRILPLTVGLVAIGGLLIGIVSVPDPGPLRDRVITMAGSLVGANIGFLYVFGIVLLIRERFAREWVRIALRIAAAWTGAISLVMLALKFAPSEAGL